MKKTSPKVKVTVTYTWTFDQKNWDETQEFTQLQDAIKSKTDFDNIDMFHHLNQICWPNHANLKVEQIHEA